MKFWEKFKNNSRVSSSSKEGGELSRKKGKNGAQNLWIIAGLGNFGSEYEGTRHNSGFSTVDKLLAKLSKDDNYTVSTEKHKFKGVYFDVRDNKGNNFIILKPYTYMNLSGESVQEAMHWYKIDESHLIVIYDDCDIGLGEIRIRASGSAGTHNGMKSVIANVPSENFPRIRVGIGHRPEQMDMIKFVLGHFQEDELKVMDEAFDKAGEAAIAIMNSGIERAMSKYNGK